ncbi:glycosyl hydrolase family 28-related protein [Acidicapsa ligni]|uniref:glycosyl hydrolase family 28-related protein n=1 Tax=Acidicapsa ligni TaxID=542300 RepID=UPI0021DFC65B|nr:glycosyl hydrolase family 28-related protein [Acidicapsa ligni]
MLKSLLAFVALSFCVPTLSATSYYTEQPKDPQAVLLTPDHFPIHGDGKADDSEAIQQAINQVQQEHNEGVVLLPSGHYRLSKTIYIWPGIRLIGYGPTRPVLVLAENTPGFQGDPEYMVFFAGRRPGARGANGSITSGADQKPSDANPGTFYSALSNVDIEIKDGNPGAVGVRARYAQHCFLAHIDFHIGSGLAGIHDGGNVAEDVHFHGGKYGIWTRKPSPGWQFAVIDASFDGQREAAIREHEAGLTLVRPQFKNVPTAIDIDASYPEELWIKDARLEDVTGPAIVISNENNPHTEINAENVMCRNVPTFAKFRESGKEIHGKDANYVVSSFSHGLHYADIGATPAIEDVFEAKGVQILPDPVRTDIPGLPAMNTWVNIRDMGAKGDGIADDTQALQQAIDAHRTIFFPAGQYRVTDTVTLKSDTVLIGLQPSITRIFLADHTKAFDGVGDPKAMIESPKGGTNIITGIGLYTNGINPRAVALKWMAGADSLVNDVRFLGGHGTVDRTPDPKPEHHGGDIYNNTHTADSELSRRWNGQYPSLWITDGGGGTFLDIWTPSTFAQAGMYISNTSTSGRVYELSSEHHVRNEIMLRNAANWQIYALQTEEERGEGGFALPLEILDSHDITVANYHSYRVVSMFQPFPYAIKVQNSRNIHFRNVHVYSDSKASFDNSVYDATYDIPVRHREFAYMDVSGNEPQKASEKESAIFANDRRVDKVTGGFFNISGGAVDAGGDPYFVDAHWQTIYRWSDAKHELIKVRDNPLDAGNLIFDKAGDLIVVSYQGNGTVYSFKPDATDLNITILKPQPAAERAGATAVLPVDYWRNENDFASKIVQKKPYQFVSPDGSLFLPAGEDFISGSLYYGIKMHDVLRAYGLAHAEPGKKFYISDESQEKTYVATVAEDGNITDAKLFADEGGEGVAQDEHGNVYLAAGDVYVYSPDGKRIDTIHVPERPQQLLFGGSDGKTLFILTRTTLYSARTKYKGL